jgi:hypothetical protein
MAPGGVFNPPPPAELPFKPIVIAQPAAPHLNIRPPALPAEQVVRRLPSTVGDVAVGGGGRFLILHLSRERKLAVFDVNVARVVKYLSFTDDVRFAAGMDKLLVALSEKRVLQRWSLTTFERELSVPLAGAGRVLSLTMGAASNGPLLVQQGGDGPFAGRSLTFHDIRTMKRLEVKWGPNPGGPLDPPYIRASANGKVFGMLGWGPVTLVWDDGRITITHMLQAGGRYVLPGPDGRTVFTDSGIFTERLKPAPGGANVRGAMPATHGRYYMAGQSVYILGDSRPLLTIPAEKVENVQGLRPGDPRLGNLLAGVQAGINDPLALDKRGYFIPAAKLLVHIPFSNDQLLLRRLDIDAELEKAGIDYLFVVSDAPVKARRGATYRYQLQVRSKKGGVKYRLESGPPGMKVSATGLVTWAVPRAADTPADVILTLSDRSGQEVVHTFRVVPGDQGEEQAPAAVPVPPVPAPPPAQQPDLPEPPPERPTLPPLWPSPVIRPPPLSANRVVQTLSSAVADMVVGGGGRYLVLHLPRERKLAVFDVSTAKMAGSVPLAADHILFTAGRDKLIVVLADNNLVQRWDLATLRREATAPLPVRDKVSAVALGSASDGPLLVASAQGVSRSELFFMDVTTLRKLPIEKTGQGHIHIMEGDGVRASADGRVFAIWRNYSNPQGIQALVLQGRQARGYYEHNNAGHLVPGPDGQVIYTAEGRYTSQVKPLDNRDRGAPFCLPALQGDWFLTVRWKDNGMGGTLAVHQAGDLRPLATLPEVELPSRKNLGSRERLTVDKRVFFLPSAQVIVTLPIQNDRLVLHRFNVEAALEKSGLDYLLVTSSPPTQVKRGTLYTYQVVVKSNKGGVQWRLDSGPPGMKLSAKGVLTWPVPKDFAEAQADVLITVTDAGGREAFHRFAIVPGDRGEEPAPAVRELPPEPARVPPAVKPPGPEARPALPAKAAAVIELRRIRISKNSFVNALAFTPDGRELLSAGDDGRMRRWSVADGKELPNSFDAHPRVSMFSVSLSADGRLLATAALDHSAKVWDAATNRLLASCSERALLIRAALSPDGKVLATGSTQLRLWEASSGRLLADLTDPRDVRARFIEAVVFSPDGRRLACTGSPHTVRVWDLATRKVEATLAGHSDVVMALALSSDGRTVASAGMDRTVKLWDLTTKQERRTLRGHLDPLNAVAFSPDGALLVSGAGATRFNPGHRGELKLWDVATGKLLADLRGHPDGISCVAFSPDGRTVASAARDRTVRLWDVAVFTGPRAAHP